MLPSKACCCLITILSVSGVYNKNLFVDALPHLTHNVKRQTNSNAVRAEAIKDAFRHAYNGYSKYAYGHDELLSSTNGFSDSR